MVATPGAAGGHDDQAADGGAGQVGDGLEGGAELGSQAEPDQFGDRS